MNGSKCAKYTFENGNVGSLQQVFPIEPACVYKVTCWIKWKGCRQVAIARSGRDGWEFSYFPFDDSMAVFEPLSAFKRPRMAGKIMKWASFRRCFAILWTEPCIVDDTLLSSKVGCIS